MAENDRRKFIEFPPEVVEGPYRDPKTGAPRSEPWSARDHDKAKQRTSRRPRFAKA